MSKDFTPGQIVVSPHTGQRVRFDAYAGDDHEFFKGEYLGNARRIPDMPPQFHYNWHEWRTSRFEAEASPDAPKPGVRTSTLEEESELAGPVARLLESKGRELYAAAERFSREIGAGVDVEVFGFMLDTAGFSKLDLARDIHKADGGCLPVHDDPAFLSWRQAIHDKDRSMYGENSTERPNVLSAADRRYGIIVAQIGMRFDSWLAEEAEAARRRYNYLPENKAPDWKAFDHLVAVAVGSDPGDWKVDILAVDANSADTPITRCDTLSEAVKVAHEIAVVSNLTCSFENPDMGQIHPDDPEPEDVDDWIDARAPATTCDIPSL